MGVDAVAGGHVDEGLQTRAGSRCLVLLIRLDSGSEALLSRRDLYLQLLDHRRHLPLASRRRRMAGQETAGPGPPVLDAPGRWRRGASPTGSRGSGWRAPRPAAVAISYENGRSVGSRGLPDQYIRLRPGEGRPSSRRGIGGEFVEEGVP